MRVPGFGSLFRQTASPDQLVYGAARALSWHSPSLVLHPVVRRSDRNQPNYFTLKSVVGLAAADHANGGHYDIVRGVYEGQQQLDFERAYQIGQGERPATNDAERAWCAAHREGKLSVEPNRWELYHVSQEGRKIAGCKISVPGGISLVQDTLAALDAHHWPRTPISAAEAEQLERELLHVSSDN